MDRGEMLTLEEVTERLAAAYLDMLEDFESDARGYPYNDADTARRDFISFVRDLRDEALGVGLPPGVIPQTTYVLLRDRARVLGEFRFRPTVPPPYNANNGHVGYNLRPSERGMGYATRGLALMCDRARELGLSGLSLPIEGHNPASVRVIKKNGGMLRRTVNDPQSGNVVSWYWIALPTA